MTEAKSNYEQNLINNYANHNNLLIFKYISSITKSDSLPQQMYLGADTATCDQDKARLFNKFFFVCLQ